MKLYLCRRIEDDDDLFQPLVVAAWDRKGAAALAARHFHETTGREPETVIVFRIPTEPDGAARVLAFHADMPCLGDH